MVKKFETKEAFVREITEVKEYLDNAHKILWDIDRVMYDNEYIERALYPCFAKLEPIIDSIEDEGMITDTDDDYNNLIMEEWEADLRYVYNRVFELYEATRRRMLGELFKGVTVSICHCLDSLFCVNCINLDKITLSSEI